LREEYGEHTCDKRRSRSDIHADFPQFEFECGFPEQDLLWTTERETFDHAIGRAHDVLNRVFREDETCMFSPFLRCEADTAVMGIDISVTAHGGIINALLSAMRRKPYALPTGGELCFFLLSVFLQVTRGFAYHRQGDGSEGIGDDCRHSVRYDYMYRDRIAHRSWSIHRTPLQPSVTTRRLTSRTALRPSHDT
jgi:hypothetical protein